MKTLEDILRNTTSIITDELATAREHVAQWKASHDNQVNLRRILMDRPDLKDRAKRMQELIAERDAAKASEQECIRQWNEYEAETSQEIRKLKEVNLRLTADLANALTRLETAEKHLHGK